MSEPIPDVDGALEIASRHEYHQNFSDALAICEAILESKPDNAAALYMSGRCLVGLDRPKDAIPRLMKVVAALPKEPRALCFLGDAYDAAGDLRQALNAYAKATIVDSGLARAWHGHGWVALRLGGFSEAERSLAESIRIQPSGLALMRLGFARLGLGKLDEARANLKKAIEKAPHLEAEIRRVAKGRVDL